MQSKTQWLDEWYGNAQLGQSSPSGKAVVQWYEGRGGRPDATAMLYMLAYALDELEKVKAEF
jgi:hypothetical protein